MEQSLIRLLKANEIECRISTINEKGLSLPLYKDARVDQRILDETFGVFGWKRSHQCINGSLYCTVEVYDKENGYWVAKQDVGTVGYAEKEKSQASDSFKRACFNWGIGRELYTAPFIWVSFENAEIKLKDRKFYCNDSFSVSAISYNDSREIVSLSIINESRKGKAVYVYHSGKRQSGIQQTDKSKKKSANNETVGENGITEQQMHTFEAELDRTGVGMDAVKNRYGIDRPQDMSGELYDKVMRALARTKSAGNVA